MARTRTRWLERRLRRRGGTAVDGRAPAAPAVPLADCLAACAAHSDKLAGNLGWRRRALAEALRELLVLQLGLTTRQDGDAARPALGKGWSNRSPELLDALLRTGTKAVECGTEEELALALHLADAVLTERAGSRAGWRLRARALEARGDDADAVLAHERYLALCRNDEIGLGTRIAGLRASAEHRTALWAELRAGHPAAVPLTGTAPAVELWSRGLDLDERGEWPEAEPYLVAALLTMAGEDRPTRELHAALGEFMDLYVARRSRLPGGLSGSRTLLAHYADARRLRELGPLADPLLGGTEVIGLGDLRNLLTGKSICLVANSGRIAASSAGEEIDAYDLVVRFNSYRIEPRATGSRTDLHATIHKHGFNWDRKVTTRLVFGGAPQEWQQSLRTRLVPGAQRYVGDASLRWPVRNIGLLDETAWPAIPTSGFNMLWLLDFLDVSPRIDLFGFDFYDSGAYRVPAAMDLPITSVHGYREEKRWVMERARHVTDLRIALR